nr:uncharacterized protein C1orf158 homolog isoform X2 [Odocoileus virginianus texanus]
MAGDIFISQKPERRLWTMLSSLLLSSDSPWCFPCGPVRCDIPLLLGIGLPYKHLITHHQEPSQRYLVSTYDDHYNRHHYHPGLPELRTWNRHQLLWLPEKVDFPLLGPPTNYGLYEQLKQKWLPPSEATLRESIYTSSYPRPPAAAMSRREHAIPVPPPRLQPVPHF